MRLVHLSDIHLSDKNIDELRNFYIEKLIEDLEEIQRSDNRKIDIIAITGDLVDRGGHSLKKHYHGHFSNPYDFFEAEFITPIREKLNLTNRNFIFIPGNHDVNELQIDWAEEKRLSRLNIEEVKGELEKNVSKFTASNRRIKPFKDFERHFHRNTDNYNFSNNGSTYFFKSNTNEKVGFLLINDSWRCSSSQGRIQNKIKVDAHYFGSQQLHEGYKYLKKKGSEFNICLFHHDLNELAESETIFRFFKDKDIRLFLYGHKHSTKGEPTINNYGKVDLWGFRPRAALNNHNEREFSYMPGYQIFDINCHNWKIDQIIYKRYNNQEKTTFVYDTGEWSKTGINKKGITLKEVNSVFNVESLVKSNFRIPERIEFYEPRLVYSQEKENNYLFHNISNEGFKLDYLIHSERKILLLGNPGIGKSTELEVLAETLWKDRTQNQLVPILINLKYFRNNDSFEDFIQVENWREIPQITFILDGLDEVADIQDLISALEVFINKNSKKNYRYVLSCRTNIYHKYLVELSDFKTFYLHSLSEYQAESILTKEFEIPYSKIEKFPFLKGYFESPFFINRFAQLIKKGGDDLTYLSLWQDYIQSSLESDKIKFKRRDLFIVAKITDTLRKAAITLELMHKNTLNESELVQIFDEQVKTAQELSLFKLDSKNAQYSFTHKQTQEYLVASSLINLDIDRILETIKIPEVEAVHPSFQNTLTFLLDLIEDQETLTKLIDWVKKNQIDILFSIDSNRLDQDVKEAIFKSYFEEVCITHTLWITTNRSVSISQIASFANSPKIHDYLIGIIKDSKNHFRARQSAVMVLFEFQLPFEINENLKKFIIQYLKNENKKIGLASDLIQLSVEQQFYKDESFTKSLFELVQNSSNAQINREVLRFIEHGFDQLQLNQFSEFLDKEFRWSHKVDKRKDNADKTIRGNGDSCWRIIARLNDFELFIKYLSQYLNDELHNSYLIFPKVQVIDRAVEFFQEEGNYTKFLSNIKNSYRFHERSDFLEEVTEKSNKQNEAIEYLTEKNLINDFFYFVIKIIKKESIQVLAKHIANAKNDERYLARLRFHLSSKSKDDLAFQLENTLIELGMSIEKEVKTDAEIEESIIAENERYQEDFNSLFDKKNVENQVQGFFNQHGPELDWKEYYKIQKQWYEENGHHKKLPLHYELISDVLRPSDKSKKQDFDNVWNYLDTETPIYTRILVEYNRAERRENNLLKINESQKNRIERWALEKIKDIDFENIKHSKKGVFYLINKNWSLFKLIHELFKVFSLNLPQSFLLDSLEFYEIQHYDSQNEKSYDRIRLAIDDDDKFKNQIIEDLKNKMLFDPVLKKHIEFAINHNLEEIYPQIEKYVLDKTSLLFYSDTIIEFLAKTKRFSAIRKIAEKTDTWEGWRAAKLLLEDNKELDYIIKHSIEFLNNEKESRFRGDALNILLKTNHHEAVQYLVNEVRQENNYKFDYLRDAEYSEFVSVDLFEELFEICFNIEFDSFEQNSVRSFYRNWLRNLVKIDFGNVMSILDAIKKKQTELERDLFNVNVLIEEVTNAYIIHKSKPYSLKEAILKAEEILGLQN